MEPRGSLCIYYLPISCHWNSGEKMVVFLGYGRTLISFQLVLDLLRDATLVNKVKNNQRRHVMSTSILHIPTCTPPCMCRHVISTCILLMYLCPHVPPTCVDTWYQLLFSTCLYIHLHVPPPPPPHTDHMYTQGNFLGLLEEDCVNMFAKLRWNLSKEVSICEG